MKVDIQEYQVLVHKETKNFGFVLLDEDDKLVIVERELFLNVYPADVDIAWIEKELKVDTSDWELKLMTVWK